MSGIIGAKPMEVKATLGRYAEIHDGVFRKESLMLDDEGRLAIHEGLSGVTVLYPFEFIHWDDCSRFLSEELRKPVFWFHIHDSDLWMYGLFDEGREVDRFNPVPDYWHEPDEEERQAWQGNPVEVAKRVPGLLPEHISRYLIQWGDEVFESDERTKAYPDDEFYYGDDWQLVDFMRKLRLVFPDDSRGEPFVDTYYFNCKHDDRVRPRRGRGM